MTIAHYVKTPDHHRTVCGALRMKDVDGYDTLPLVFGDMKLWEEFAPIGRCLRCVHITGQLAAKASP